MTAFLNKQLTRAAAISRYGPIDFASLRWVDETKWMGLLQVPKVFPNLSIEHIYCNRDIHGPLSRALNSVDEAGLGYLLKSFDGCFNIRIVRGLLMWDQFSSHCYALGLDFNAAENPLGATSGGFYEHPELVRCFTDEGFDWGGAFKGRKDPMHFSYCWE